MRTLTRITNCLLSQELHWTPDTCPLQNQKIRGSIMSTIAALVPILLNTRYGQMFLWKTPSLVDSHLIHVGVKIYWNFDKKILKLLSCRIAGVCEHYKQHTCDVLHRSTRRTRRTSNINGLHLKTAPTTLICNYFPAIKYLSSWNEPGRAWLAVILCFAIALFPWPHCFKLTSCREEHLFYFNPAKIELANVEKVNYKHRYRLADSILTSTTDPG